MKNYVVRWTICLLLTIGGMTQAADPAAHPAPPNIVIILADDQGYGDVSALNPESKITTPHIDRLAQEGMTFTDGHSASAVCTPSRYALLTGRYAWRTRLQHGVLYGYDSPLIATNQMTVADVLKKRGYSTACIGKWHLGLGFPLKGGGFAAKRHHAWRIDYAAPVQNGPLDCGFDRFFGISASLDMPPYVFIEDRHVTEPPTVEKDFTNKIRRGPASATFEAVEVLPRLTQAAVAYIDGQAAAARNGTPFFLYFALTAPHTPIVPAPEWREKSGLNLYADFVMQTDAAVGAVLDALDRHRLTHDTLVIFTADNGCSPAADVTTLESKGHRPSYIRRGYKADIYEGGHRVPFLARWPARVAAATRCDALVGQNDIMATVAELSGAPLPENAGVDSVSFLPLLLGARQASIRDSLVNHSINGSFALRQGPWKLALCPDSGGWSAPRPDAGPRRHLPPVQLFNLVEDPAETNNLAARHPERVREMTDALRALVARGRSTPGDAVPNDVEVRLVKEKQVGRGDD